MATCRACNDTGKIACVKCRRTPGVCPDCHGGGCVVCGGSGRCVVCSGTGFVPCPRCPPGEEGGQ